MIAKFIGDAVMAVFGLTELHEDDASSRPGRRRDARDARAPERGFEQRYGVVLATRTGINTGTVAGKGLVPDRNFVAGDAANSAARLQQHAEPGEILLAESTFRLVRASVDAEPLLPLELKGKQGPSPPTGLAVTERSELAPGWRLLSSAATTRSLSSSGRSSEPSPRTGRLVTVVGAPGIGKSRLAHEFVTRLGERATVLQAAAFRMARGSRSGRSQRW